MRASLSRRAHPDFGQFPAAARAERMPWQEIGGWLGRGPGAAAVTVPEARVPLRDRAANP